MTMTQDWKRKIEELGPCKEAVRWLTGQASFESAWQTCERGDWMLWLLGKLSDKPRTISRKKLVLTACACARLTLPSAGENRTVAEHTLEVTEQYARGENGVTLDDVRAALASYAAYAAYVAVAAYGVYGVYGCVVGNRQRSEILNQCAEIVRQHYNFEEVNSYDYDIS